MLKRLSELRAAPHKATVTVTAQVIKFRPSEPGAPRRFVRCTLADGSTNAPVALMWTDDPDRCRACT